MWSADCSTEPKLFGQPLSPRREPHELSSAAEKQTRRKMPIAFFIFEYFSERLQLQRNPTRF